MLHMIQTVNNGVEELILKCLYQDNLERIYLKILINTEFNFQA